MFSIVDQNQHFVVINKHHGVSVQKEADHAALLPAVAAHIGVEKVYLVHRLDKMTSGLLLLATSSHAASVLSGLFASREIEKFYLALSAKKPRKKQGLIVGDMAKGRRGSWKLLTSKDNPARTRFTSITGGEGRRLFLCRPYTGKTHQIRVAMKSIGSPLIGDDYYGGEPADRGYLHAYGLQFTCRFTDVQPETRYRYVLPPSEGELWPALPVEWEQPWHLIS
ncbi:TIGR01621 family pseudouridine synthase [Salinivibrio kushneri]|uniref:TIGR01621 family pseudouridine synthase n=1 Tax=Salinivibrio kushneri TaxID=1908198 RepID=A0AA47KNK6_9GAMM|nr:TIGR01621 family pseudouridine synthase [Salinivibrio kushneri]WBA09942.1 TIGR01621 family pseudouridine synthase [Salinivibrio kushneri]